MTFVMLYVMPVTVGMMLVGIIFALEEISK
jgi:hypothetical protein